MDNGSNNGAPSPALDAPKIRNPLTGKDCSPQVAKYVEECRTVRRNATKAARSGNPAKRGPARRVLKQVGPAILAAYTTEVGR